MRASAASISPRQTGQSIRIVALTAYALVSAGSVLHATEGDAPAAYEATRARPLFSPTRRPPPPPAPALMPPPVAVIAPPAAMAPDLAVSGVIIGSENRIAIVKRPSDTTFTRLTPGSEIDGWTVSEIDPRAVVLKRDDRSVTIGMPEPSR